ncbi:hypothetical protein [Asticcacaulis solisilvae]|uniref:hypothetical protein n=1 Tax=Asticcacaulis solisilvae TaxID=1217274 RepID=UPI003FD808C4
MNLGTELEKAWQVYQSHLSLRGIDSPVSRVYYRIWCSLEAAIGRGLREPLTLCLTDQDFDWYCECFLISPEKGRMMRMDLAPGIAIFPQSPPYSYFWGHDARGKLKHYAVFEDREFDPELMHMASEVVEAVKIPELFKKAS